MLEEFKKFALRGNVVDLAIGVVIGAAFSKIVDSLVADVIMPVVGAVTGGLDFSNKFVLFKALTGSAEAPATYAAAKAVGATLGWGQFVTVTLNFLIVAFVLFLVVKAMNTLKKKEEEAPVPAPEPTRSELLLEEIRDLLKK